MRNRCPCDVDWSVQFPLKFQVVRGPHINGQRCNFSLESCAYISFYFVSRLLEYWTTIYILLMYICISVTLVRAEDAVMYVHVLCWHLLLYNEPDLGCVCVLRTKMTCSEQRCVALNVAPMTSVKITHLFKGDEVVVSFYRLALWTDFNFPSLGDVTADWTVMQSVNEGLYFHSE